MAPPIKTRLRRRIASRPRWQSAEPPVPPRRAPRLVEVDNAYISEYANGTLVSTHRPTEWFRGAVYDENNRIVRSSQKLLAHRRVKRVAADPDRIERQSGARALDGTWLYGGTWATMFGHFLVETLTTLWPSVNPRPAGLIFNSSVVWYEVQDFHRRLIELAGWGDLPIEVVREEPIAVERLIVPGRAAVLHAWVHPQGRQVWQTIAQGFRDRGGPERVYMSRTLMNANRRRKGHRNPIRTTAEHDQMLDRVFADHGFHVIHPEKLDIDTQLSTVASAAVIAGLSGSALHQSAFLPSGSRVLEVGDGRSSRHGVPMQVAIDAALGHQRCFLPGTLEARGVDRALRRLGL